MTTLHLTGLDGPDGRMSRADMGAAARRALPFPTLGAWYGGLLVHGPVRMSGSLVAGDTELARCTCRVAGCPEH